MSNPVVDKLSILRHYLDHRYGKKFHDRDVLQRWQSQQVHRLLNHVLPRSPFYRRHFQTAARAHWQTLPVVNKHLLMDHFNEWNTLGISRDAAWALATRAESERSFAPLLGKIAVGLSSGTSGQRGLFLVSPHERRRWAGAMLAKMLPTSIFKPQKIAFFLRADNRLYQTLKSRTLDFQFFDLLQPWESSVSRLNTFAPTILVAPASVLLLLAQTQETQSLRIHPRKIIAVAEVLDPLDEARLTRHFKQPIHQIYQATEGFLAATCSHGTLHFNEDLVVVQKEYVDKPTGKFVPIITDFSRTTQPIIRYRLDDIITEKIMPCACGSPFTAIEKIEGRCDDIFYLPKLNHSGSSPVFPDFITRAVMLSSEHLQEYKILQTSQQALTIFLKPQPGYPLPPLQTAVKQALVNLCQRQEVQVPHMTFVSDWPLVPGKKMKRGERGAQVCQPC